MTEITKEEAEIVAAGFVKAFQETHGYTMAEMLERVERGELTQDDVRQLTRKAMQTMGIYLQ